MLGQIQWNKMNCFEADQENGFHFLQLVLKSVHTFCFPKVKLHGQKHRNKIVFTPVQVIAFMDL